MTDSTTLDVLLYLFEQCFDADLTMALADEEHALRGELREAGFPDRAVTNAFSWLGSLTETQDEFALNASRAGAVRVYTEDERERLDIECRGLLHALEHMGLLDGEARERVIDRAMALDAHDLDVEALRWIVLVVLLNLPGREESCTTVEELLFAPDDGWAH